MERSKLKVYYANIANMGDRLNELIIRDCFGYEPVHHSALTGELSAIGSGLDIFTLHGTPYMRARQRLYGRIFPHVRIWGTGFINRAEGDEVFYRRRMDFRAVRGELSRQRVEKLLGRPLDIPTGDAGILAPLLLDGPVEKTRELGIVPHICDLPLKAVAELSARYEDALLIDLRDDALTVLRQIASCRLLLSSSLHGLVAADAFGIPNRHIVFSDLPRGDGFKFDDYYSAYGVPHVMTDLRCEKPPELSEIEGEYAISAAMVEEKSRQMIASFPYPVAGGVLHG